VLVHAASASLATGEIELLAPRDGALVRDLLIAPMSPTPASAVGGPSRLRGPAQLSGHVLRPNGQPISGAQVIVLGTGVSTTTNDAGHFELNALPGGTRTVEARALGYLPARAVVDLAGRHAATAELELAAQTPILEAVTVFGRAPARADAQGFAERSRGFFGRFITADQIARSGAMSVPDLLRIVPGLRVTQMTGSPMSTVLSRGEAGFSSSCMPAVYLDGNFIAEGASSLDNLMRPSDIGGIEVYVDGNTAPAQYQRGACGSIVIWSRVMVLPR
jgi:Carboxypeptidase regulatory-like domain/TonB-dependent Receptor Plug Domain